jgi:hypothetical protein
MNTFSINGVEIFSTGKWNGDEYTQEDLEIMVDAFNETKTGARPYLKLGHDNKQKLSKEIQVDGMPALGWVERIYIKGNKLVADFVDIPRQVHDLINSRAYRKVSSEIFWNITIGEKHYKRMLAAVALLGADTPGVMNLNDILAMYKIYSSNCEKISVGDSFEINELKNYEMENKKMEKTEIELKLEQELAEQKKQYELKVEETKKTDAELEDLRKFKLESEQNQLKLEKEKQELEVKNFVQELKAEKLCTPAMEEMVTEILGDEKKEYTANKLNKKQVLKEVLKLFKVSKDVNFTENSSMGKNSNENQTDELDKQAKAYMDKNKCTYAQALKAVMKNGNK